MGETKAAVGISNLYDGNRMTIAEEIKNAIRVYCCGWMNISFKFNILSRFESYLIG